MVLPDNSFHRTEGEKKSQVEKAKARSSSMFNCVQQTPVTADGLKGFYLFFFLILKSKISCFRKNYYATVPLKAAAVL